MSDVGSRFWKTQKREERKRTAPIWTRITRAGLRFGRQISKKFSWYDRTIKIHEARIRYCSWESVGASNSGASLHLMKCVMNECLDMAICSHQKLRFSTWFSARASLRENLSHPTIHNTTQQLTKSVKASQSKWIKSQTLVFFYRTFCAHNIEQSWPMLSQLLLVIRLKDF